MAPPCSALQERLLACIVNKSSKSSMLHLRHSTSKMDGKGDTPEANHLDGMKLKKPMSVYEDVKAVEMTLQFFTSGGHAGGRTIHHTVKMPMRPQRDTDELEKIEQKAKLCPIDKYRVTLFLNETR